jgi:hypothetical protein
MKVKQTVALQDISDGQVFHVRTRNTTYVINKELGKLYISGHEKYCPYTMHTEVSDLVQGEHFIFSTPEHPSWVHTSRIQYILEVTE